MAPPQLDSTRGLSELRSNITLRNLKYHALNLLQLGLGLIFQVLLGRYFGASVDTDIYFVCATIVSFLTVISGFLTDQFLQFYNDTRVTSGRDSSVIFYSAVWRLSLLVGMLTFLVSYAMKELIVSAFVSGFSDGALLASAHYFGVVSLSLIPSRIIAVNNQLLNAEMKFGFFYLSPILLAIANTVVLITLSPEYGINAIAYSIVFTNVLICLLQQTYVHRVLRIRLALLAKHDTVRALIRNSFAIRLGHQIYSLKDPFVSNLLSQLPAGTISLYSYGYKMAVIAFAITSSPIIQVFSSKSSLLIAQKKLQDVKFALKRASFQNGLLFLFISIIGVLTLQQILALLFKGKFSAMDITTIWWFYLAFIPLHILLSIESPLVALTNALKQAGIIMKIAVINLVLFIGLAFAAIEWGSIFWLPLAMAGAQVANLTLYAISVRKALAQRGGYTKEAIP